MSNLFFMLMLVVVIFFVLWPCISFAIEQTELRTVNRVLAPAVTILCIVGMVGSFGPGQKESLVDVILIPWAALGYSIFFVIFLWLISLSLRFRKGSDEWCERSEHKEKEGQHEWSRATCTNRTLLRNERRQGKPKAGQTNEKEC